MNPRHTGLAHLVTILIHLGHLSQSESAVDTRCTKDLGKASQRHEENYTIFQNTT